MFVKCAPLQGWEVESDRVGFVGILAKQIMAAKMIFGQLDKFCGRGCVAVGKYLFEDVGA